MRLWWMVAGSVVGLDQLTKLWAIRALKLYDVTPKLPFFNFTLTRNTGAAFSFLNDASGWQRWFFVALALGVGAGIVWWLKRLNPADKWNGLALSLILGGAIGNVVDRVLDGYVVDFIDIYYKAASCMPLFASVPTTDGYECHWPAFNLADSAITVGAVLLILDSFRGNRARGKGLDRNEDSTYH